MHIKKATVQQLLIRLTDYVTQATKPLKTITGESSGETTFENTEAEPSALSFDVQNRPFVQLQCTRNRIPAFRNRQHDFQRMGQRRLSRIDNHHTHTVRLA